MKFIGKPEGKLMKGAPGNYIHGKEYHVPYSYSQWKWWQLMEDAPELQVPDITEEKGVFEEFVYVPDEEKSSEDYHGPALRANEFLVPDADAMTVPDEEALKELEKQEAEPRLTRDELKKILDDAGVEYNKRLRTETLRVLVKKLDKAS